MKFEKTAFTLLILASAKRLKILKLLNEKKELQVLMIAKNLNFTISNTCQHLFKLRMNNLVNVRRVGKNTFYSLSPGVKEILKQIENI